MQSAMIDPMVMVSSQYPGRCQVKSTSKSKAASRSYHRVSGSSSSRGVSGGTPCALSSAASTISRQSAHVTRPPTDHSCAAIAFSARPAGLRQQHAGPNLSCRATSCVPNLFNARCRWCARFFDIERACVSPARSVHVYHNTRRERGSDSRVLRCGRQGYPQAQPKHSAAPHPLHADIEGRSCSRILTTRRGHHSRRINTLTDDPASTNGRSCSPAESRGRGRSSAARK